MKNSFTRDTSGQTKSSRMRDGRTSNRTIAAIYLSIKNKFYKNIIFSTKIEAYLRGALYRTPLENLWDQLFFAAGNSRLNEIQIAYREKVL